MNKMIMSLACSFNGWLNKKYGVISANDYYLFGKEVHLKPDAFFKMFKEYERIENYTESRAKVYTRKDGVTYFALVEHEELESEG